MKKYPILLRPVSKSTIWGGNLLKSEYGKTSHLDNIAESWELTVRDNENSVIANGDYSGTLLSDYISEDRIGILGTNAEKYDRFPILIKFIDAADRLSIQVHPDNEYARKNANELGKTEMWYIVKAERGAQIVYGLRGGYTAEDFAKYVRLGRTEEILNYVDVREGDVYFIPSGQVHAIGAGILIAEIQQNSDVTYRVFDYNRRQSDGSLRQLHTQEAADVINVRTSPEIEKIQFSVPDHENGGTLLCSCEYFKSKKYSISSGDSVKLLSDKSSFVSILVLESSEAVISTKIGTYDISKGESYFIPAGFGEFSICGHCEVIVTEIN
ncbi:MAG: mannose-6-phosphate isomerase [Ruminococcaceae bacterium]|nr:mannose-6-phosphate isomerase [Oscillospiraceae bacterium]